MNIKVNEGLAGKKMRMKYTKKKEIKWNLIYYGLLGASVKKRNEWSAVTK